MNDLPRLRYEANVIRAQRAWGVSNTVVPPEIYHMLRDVTTPLQTKHSRTHKEQNAIHTYGDLTIHQQKIGTYLHIQHDMFKTDKIIVDVQCLENSVEITCSVKILTGFDGSALEHPIVLYALMLESSMACSNKRVARNRCKPYCIQTMVHMYVEYVRRMVTDVETPGLPDIPLVPAGFTSVHPSVVELVNHFDFYGTSTSDSTDSSETSDSEDD